MTQDIQTLSIFSTGVEADMAEQDNGSELLNGDEPQDMGVVGPASEDPKQTMVAEATRDTAEVDEASNRLNETLGADAQQAMNQLSTGEDRVETPNKSPEELSGKTQEHIASTLDVGEVSQLILRTIDLLRALVMLGMHI